MVYGFSSVWPVMLQIPTDKSFIEKAEKVFGAKRQQIRGPRRCLKQQHKLGLERCNVNSGMDCGGSRYCHHTAKWHDHDGLVADLSDKVG